MKVQPSVDQLQDVTVEADRAVEGGSEGQNAIGQSRSESELDVVVFIAVRLDGDQTAVDEAHRADRLARLAEESIFARAVELVVGFVFQVRNAEAVVLTWRCQTAGKFDGAVFTAEVCVAVADVVVASINASTMQARMDFALVDVFL